MNEFDQREAILQDRRKAYAQQLAGNQAPQGRMVGNTYVAANPLEYLAAGLRGVGAMQGEEQAGQELKALQGQRSEANKSAMANALRYSQGTPEITLPEGQAGPVMPAQAPDMGKAYAALMESPDYQQAGFQGAMQYGQQKAAAAQKTQENQRLMGILQSTTPQQAIAAGVPPEMVKQYHESRNYGRDEVSFVDTGGALTPKTKYGDVPTNVAPIPKTGNPFSDLVVRGENGQIGPNVPLVKAKEGIAAKGAAKTNVSVNMPDKKFYEGLGTAVSGQIEQGFTQAKSAVETLNNANQIAQSLDKALAGPLANQRLALAQIGQTLGIGGKDNAEILSNTRNVIQGLARQELSAAGQMKGQGQITESERAILRKAEAGQINEFTKVELETFLGAIRKTARSRVESHKRNLQTLSNDPQSSTILPYLQIDAPEDFGSPSPVAQPQINSLLEKYK